MQLTLYTDYSLRTLIYLGAVKRPATIAEIAGSFGISRNHLSKVANHLVHLGLVHSMQGKGGGLNLAVAPDEVRIGDVVRKVEPHFNLVECFNREKDTCPITPSCGLKHVLAEAEVAFMSTLNRYTLQDMLDGGDAMLSLLNNGKQSG